MKTNPEPDKGDRKGGKPAEKAPAVDREKAEARRQAIATAVPGGKREGR